MEGCPTVTGNCKQHIMSVAQLDKEYNTIGYRIPRNWLWSLLQGITKNDLLHVQEMHSSTIRNW